MHNLITARAITEVDNFKKKWKIKTNGAKFQAISFGRKNPPDIRLQGRTIAHSESGTMLGLKLANSGLAPHVTNRVNSAKAQLMKIRRFKNLSQKNKRTLYLALVKSKLVYPAAPLNIMNKSQLLKLQRIQNSGIRSITNTSLLNGITSASLHETTKIDAINVTLHQQANNT